MTTVASYIVHYGAEWLNWSVRSVADIVDQIHIFYTPFPSHGHGTNLVCPETREDIKISLHAVMRRGYDIIWHDCPRFPHEGAHREFAVETCQKYGADLVLVVDADEVWDVDALDAALTFAKKENFHSYRIGMRHFFRSLHWVCDDAAMPTRIIKPNVPGNSEEYISGKVFHFGYAQTPKIIFYKQDIHGHKAEWRQGWFENIFMPWRPGIGDVHPTSVNYWNPIQYIEDESGTLEYLVGDHPFWNMEVIE